MIGLQSTGEARAKGATKAAGVRYQMFNILPSEIRLQTCFSLKFSNDQGDLDDFVSAPNEDLKRVIMMMFPLPPSKFRVI